MFQNNSKKPPKRSEYGKLALVHIPSGRFLGHNVHKLGAYSMSKWVPCLTLLKKLLYPDSFSHMKYFKGRKVG
jgi:hypothetical protein